MRDLLAVEFDAKSALPTDEISHGFDNITVGDLPPALLDRYLSAALKIARQAVGLAEEPEITAIRVRPDITQECHVPGLPPGTRAAWYAVAQCQAQQGKDSEARKALKQACNLDPYLSERVMKDQIWWQLSGDMERSQICDMGGRAAPTLVIAIAHP